MNFGVSAMIKIKPGSRKNFKFSDLELAKIYTYHPLKSNPIVDYAVEFEITDKQNLFVRLDDLDHDYDIYISRQINLHEDGNPIVAPYTNSTNYGKKEEVIFAQLPEGPYYLVVRNNIFPPAVKDISATLFFDSNYFDSKLALLPDDPLLDKQWYLFNKGYFSSWNPKDLTRQEHDGVLPDADIRAPEAWRKKHSASEIIVAVVDQGIEIKHADLRDNIWRNKNEKDVVKGEGDHDENGFNNDIYGWNFGNNTNDPSPLIKPSTSTHGTHVAGTIGASGNNGIGITGVAWDVQIMPLSVEDPGSENFVNTNKAIQYAVDNGADIVNLSFGRRMKLNPAELMTYMRANGSFVPGTPMYITRLLKDDLNVFRHAKAADVLLVIAAGNDGYRASSLADWSQIGNLDQTLSPMNFISGFFDNAVNVASSDGMSQLSPYTNTGLSVDLSAPGGNTTNGQEYGVISTMPIGYKKAQLNELRNKAEREGFDPSNVGEWSLRLRKDWEETNEQLIVQDGSDYGYSQGTSMAAPVVSGSAALIKAVNNQVSANEIRQIMLSSATTNRRLKGLAGQNGLQLNLEAALDLAENWQGKKSFYDLQKGNQKDNRLLATTSNSWLIGRAGDDLLRGSKGDDLIHGGAGDDLIVPGEGLDRIRGGRGEDVIRYYHSDESPIARPDRIAMDAADKIDISALDGNPDKSGVQRLKFIGANDFSGVPGQLMAKSNGFFVDLDGDAFADFGVLFTSKLGFEIGREHFLL